jgi:hypothetical protein
VQFPDYGTVIWSRFGRNFSRKHCDFSTYLPKRERAQYGACAKAKFLIMEQYFGPLAVEIIPVKHRDFSTYLAKKESSVGRICRGAVP